jgi:hypothetical protein
LIEDQIIADFCCAIKIHGWITNCSFNTKQAFQGKTLNCPRLNALFIKRIPFSDKGLYGYLPTDPEYVTPHIGFFLIAPRFCLEFLQTLPHDNALAL